MSTLTRSYKRFFNTLKVLDYFGDNQLTSWLAYYFTAKLNPYLFQRERVKLALGHPSLSLSAIQQQIYLKRYLNQYIRFGRQLFFYKKLDIKWVEKNIKILNLPVVDNISKKGGLFLTYHHHHHHFLFSILGILKNKVHVIASAPETSIVYKEMKEYIDKLHQDTSAHFYGGDYIFIKPTVNYLRNLYNILEHNELVFSLNDNIVLNNKRTQQIQFLNKLMTIPTGTIEIALKMNKPIYCGLLEWKEGNKFELDLVELNSNHGVLGILKEYFEFLEQKTKQNPSIWEGWQWFQDCHEIKGNL